MLFESSIHESNFAGGAFVVDWFGVHLLHVTFYVALLLAGLAADQAHIAEVTLLRLEEDQRFQIHLSGIYNRVGGAKLIQRSIPGPGRIPGRRLSTSDATS